MSDTSLISMVNSNLVPERRTDKTGVSRIKWVRPVSTGTSKSVLPAPAPVSSVHETPRMLALFESSNLRGYVNGLESLIDRRLVRELEQALADVQPQFSSELRYQISDGLDSIFDNLMIPSLITDLGNMTVFSDSVMHPESKRRDLARLMDGLKKDYDDRDYREASEFSRNVAVALVTVAARLDDVYIEKAPSGAVRIKSAGLRALVHRRPKDAEEISRIVNEHGSDDPGLVKDILEHGEQALRGGLL